MTRVTLEMITKRYVSSGVHAVKDLSLTIEPGTLLCLLGPSGCGKTTILKILAGLTEPDAGKVFFDSEEVTGVKPERRGAVMVFQNHLLFPFMNVAENVGFGLRMRGEAPAKIRTEVHHMLRLLQLDGMERRKPSELSGGQRQRVSLARALVVRPRVLLLDEPLSNLDQHLRDEMRDLILRMKERLEVTTLFVTHDQQEAAVLSDRIALMFGGVIRQIGESRDFYERPAGLDVAAFFGNRNVVSGAKRGQKVETVFGTLSVTDLPDVPDGPVSVVVRPEAIEFGKTGENTFNVEVKRSVYMGTHIRHQVYFYDTEWDIVAPSGSVQPSAGEHVAIRLPPEKIWIIAQ